MTDKKYTKLVTREFTNYLIKKCKEETSNLNDLFDFIPDKNVQKHLLKSYRESVFIKNVVDNLHVNYTDAHPFSEIQILHCASICEVLINHIASSYQLIGRSKSFFEKTEAFKISGIIEGDLKDAIDKLWEIRNCIHISKAVTMNMKFYKKLTKDHNDLVVLLCSSLRIFVNNNMN